MRFEFPNQSKNWLIVFYLALQTIVIPSIKQQKSFMKAWMWTFYVVCILINSIIYLLFNVIHFLL